MVSPSALAVLRLMTSSYFVGCSMGSTAGFVPLRISTTYLAARRLGDVGMIPASTSARGKPAEVWG
jgi:hypothetical protein